MNRKLITYTKSKTFQVRDGILRDWNNGSEIVGGFNGEVLCLANSCWFTTRFINNEQTWTFLRWH